MKQLQSSSRRMYAVVLNGGPEIGDKILIVNQSEKDGIDQAIERHVPIEVQGVTIFPNYIRWIENRGEQVEPKSYRYDPNTHSMVEE